MYRKNDALLYFPTIRTLHNNNNQATISLYAHGRDYHKIIRRKLQQLANKIMTITGHFSYRAFCDSAPTLEKAIGEKANLGWIGKNTLLINKEIGSWFFLGELFTDLSLPADQSSKKRCGNCTACLNICPTKALISPYQLNANRCISYLTIEHKGSISKELRPLMGNHIYGCNECQLVCPWNKFAKKTEEKSFLYSTLKTTNLIALFDWDEKTFLKNMEGSPIRRIGHEQWLRNIAIALGNATPHQNIFIALQNKLAHVSDLVREHILWAIERIENADK